MAIVRDGRVIPLTVSDRLRPPGRASRSAGSTRIPPRRRGRDGEGRGARRAHAARPRAEQRHRLSAADVDPDGSVRVVEVAARIPGGQMADLVRHAVGVDLVEVALRFRRSARRFPTSSCKPKFRTPTAIRFFTAQPGPLPTGKVISVGSPRQGARGAGRRAGRELHPSGRDDPARAHRRRPARLRDRGRSDGPGGARALRGRRRARRGRHRVECDLLVRPRALPRVARRGPAGGYRFATSTANRRPATCFLATTSTCRSTRR